MKSYKNDLRSALELYAVTDRAWLNIGAKNRSLYECVKDALKGGATCIQLREKNLIDINDKDFFLEALKIKRLCAKYNAPFIVNDNVLLAKKLDADGVHVGQHDMEVTNARAILGKEKIIGVSANTVNEALLAQKNGADYLGVGAVFQTSSKSDAKSVSIEMLIAICASVKIPVVAIGGINLQNIKQLAKTGIAGVAVISAIFSNEDIVKATHNLKNIIQMEI